MYTLYILSSLDSALLQKEFEWSTAPSNDNGTVGISPPALEEDMYENLDDFPSGLITLY